MKSEQLDRFLCLLYLLLEPISDMDEIALGYFLIQQQAYTKLKKLLRMVS